MITNTPTTRIRPHRRRIGRWLLLLLLLVIVIDAFFIEPTWLQTTHVTVPIADLTPAFDGFRLVQLSDLHYPVGLPEKYYRTVIDRTNALHPDLIVLTGDYIPVGLASLQGFMHHISRLRSRYGVVAVLGNHDYYNRVRLTRAFRAAGITVLDNAAHPITRQGQRLWILGIDDLWYGDPDLPTALRGVPAPETKILLAHEPDFADIACRYPIALQLSGHSHGGQVRLPVIGALHVPRGSTHYPCGLAYAGKMPVYTNRGIGGVGLFGHVLRFGCRPEITEITLSAK
ncbi:MAG: metallophosphoesterase [Armatimonadota bacterium]